MHSFMYQTTVIRMLLFITGRVKEKPDVVRKFMYLTVEPLGMSVNTHMHGPNSDAVKANSLLNGMVHEAETIISSAVSNREDSTVGSPAIKDYDSSKNS
jgi:hypothetical protein